MKLIRKGEYDLANISLIGFDPNTGRTFEACWAEWEAERDRLMRAWFALKWWQVFRAVKLRWQVMNLVSHLGTQ